MAKKKLINEDDPRASTLMEQQETNLSQQSQSAAWALAGVGAGDAMALMELPAGFGPFGLQLSWPITPDLALYPTFDYYFMSGGSLWALNFDLKYRPPTRYGAWYVGGGLNWSHASSGGVSGSNTNLNLLTGLEGRRGRTRPYVEAKFILGNGSSFQIVGGVSWR